MPCSSSTIYGRHGSSGEEMRNGGQLDFSLGYYDSLSVHIFGFPNDLFAFRGQPLHKHRVMTPSRAANAMRSISISIAL